MRTNIVIDDQLLQEALQMSGLNTKKAVVDQALKLYVQMLHQQALRQLRGKLRWEGDLEASRTNL
ncbi:MAG: type II toxin-antitoxin system VapB family antitoxin [Bacteroidetes bacterium]|nr:MAG: type II toxin-antitoxin system VapB family antitoxin [Bacteroidota bacterium]